MWLRDCPVDGEGRANNITCLSLPPGGKNTDWHQHCTTNTVLISLQNYRAQQIEKLFFWQQVGEFNLSRTLNSVKWPFWAPLEREEKTTFSRLSINCPASNSEPKLLIFGLAWQSSDPLWTTAGQITESPSDLQIHHSREKKVCL